MSLALVTASMLVTGCAAEPPLVPPTELTSITQTVQLDQRWKSKAGKSDRGYFEPWVGSSSVVIAGSGGTVRSIERSNGKQRWSVDLDARLSSGVSGDDKRVYVSSTNGVVHALDVSSGEVLWTASASSEVLMPVSAGFGAVVVRSADGRIVTLDPETGEERWSVSNTPPALTLNGYSRPLLLDGGVLTGLDDGRLLAMNLGSGKLIWESVISVPTGRSEVERLVDVDAELRVDNAAIYVVNYQGNVASLEPARGQLIWSVPFSSTAGLELSGDHLIVVDDEDIVHALDKGNGQEIWAQAALRGRRLSPPAVNARGDVVVGDFEGFIHVLSGDKGELIARTRLGDERIVTRPVVIPAESADDTAAEASTTSIIPALVVVQGNDGKVAAYEFNR